MTEPTTAGAGWTCANCGVFVPYNQAHGHPSFPMPEPIKAPYPDWRNSPEENYQLGYEAARQEIERLRALLSWITGACVDELPHSEIRAAISRFYFDKEVPND